MADDKDDCGDEFVGYNEWAVGSLGVTLFTDFVYDYEDGERGVFVAEDITPQTRVLSVPFASLLTLEWLREQAASAHSVYANVSIFRSLVETPRGAWDIEQEDDALALALLYERFVVGDASSWRPHLELLPKSYDNLLYFTTNETQRLRGSNVFLLAQQMHRKVQQDYERLRASTVPELIDIALEFHPGLTRESMETSFSIDQYQWALSTIWSRFVSLRLHDESDDAEAFPVLKAMAPVFDMLNHDPDAEVSHGYNSETHALEVVTHQHVAAGTQLCIHYGAVSNQKLLTLYGFVIPGNQFDTMELWLPMDKNITSLYEAKAQALHDLGIDHEMTAFELTAMDGEDDVDPAMLLAARVAQLECQDEAELKRCVELLKFGETVSKANEARALRMLVDTLEAMLAQYEESEVRDEEEEEGVQDDHTRHVRHLEMIAVVCESDRLILESTIDALKKLLAKVLPKTTGQEEAYPVATR
jgi:hypothetical protein